MKLPTILLASAVMLAAFQPMFAAPTSYQTNCILGGILCVDHRYTTNSPHHGISLSIHTHKERQSPSICSAITALPLIGPYLQSLVPLLRAIGLAEIDASSKEPPSLTADQLSSLADLENVLLNATHEVTSGISINFATTSVLQARTIFLLGSIMTSLPVIGPILLPLVPLLQSMGLDSVDAAPGAVYTMSLTQDQSVKLAQLKDILEQSIPDIMPGRSRSTSSSNNAAGASPDADAPVAILASTQLDESGEDASVTTSTTTTSATM